MTRIFFWSADSSGCAYYRCTLAAEALVARGHEVHVSTKMPDEWRRTAQVIVGQRVSQPGASYLWQQLAKQGQARMVYEVDDDLLDIDPSNKPAWAFFSRPEIRDNIVRNIEVADLVTVSTAPLAEVVSKLNSRVMVLPNCVPASLLDVERRVQFRERITLGWSGGASHTLDLAELGSSVIQFMRRHPEVGLHVMGDAGAHAQLSKSLGGRVRFTPWVESVPEFCKHIDFDVSLAPLRPSVFNASKSHIRLLEAAALGIPVVASDFGPYAEFVRHGSTGYLVRRPHEWSKYLRNLLDVEHRAAMGKQARELARQHTIESNIHLWERAYAS